MVAKNSLRRMGMPLAQVISARTMIIVIGVYKEKDIAIGAYGEIGTALVANTQLAAERVTLMLLARFSM